MNERYCMRENTTAYFFHTELEVRLLQKKTEDFRLVIYQELLRLHSLSDSSPLQIQKKKNPCEEKKKVRSLCQ